MSPVNGGSRRGRCCWRGQGGSGRIPLPFQDRHFGNWVGASGKVVVGFLDQLGRGHCTLANQKPDMQGQSLALGYGRLVKKANATVVAVVGKKRIPGIGRIIQIDHAVFFAVQGERLAHPRVIDIRVRIGLFFGKDINRLGDVHSIAGIKMDPALFDLTIKLCVPDECRQFGNHIDFDVSVGGWGQEGEGAVFCQKRSIIRIVPVDEGGKAGVFRGCLHRRKILVNLVTVLHVPEIVGFAIDPQLLVADEDAGVRRAFGDRVDSLCIVEVKEGFQDFVSLCQSRVAAYQILSHELALVGDVEVLPFGFLQIKPVLICTGTDEQEV